MSYNGSGTFNLYTPGNPVVTGTTISSTWANNTLTDIATGLSTAITKNGQTTITANLPMAGFRHTGVGNANARTTYASAADVQDGTPVYLTSPAGTNTITATAAYSMAAYAEGQKFVFIPAATNTGATTLNVNSIGAKNIYAGNSALVGGELKANKPVEVFYDGTQFQLMGPVYKQPTRTVLTSGTGATYTTPTGATRINVLCKGGGGNGNSGGAGSANGGGGGGGGGGEGGTAVKLIVGPATSYTYTVGGAGSNSSFGTLTGNLGGGGAAGDTTPRAGVGGAGGAASGGDYNIQGAPGASADNGGGGNNVNIGGIGGAGGGQGGGIGGSAGNNGAAAGQYGAGGGGGGGGDGAAGSAGNGGAGSAGVIIVDEYYD